MEDSIHWTLSSSSGFPGAQPSIMSDSVSPWRVNITIWRESPTSSSSLRVASISLYSTSTRSPSKSPVLALWYFFAMSRVCLITLSARSLQDLYLSSLCSVSHFIFLCHVFLFFLQMSHFLRLSRKIPSIIGSNSPSIDHSSSVVIASLSGFVWMRAS